MLEGVANLTKAGILVVAALAASVPAVAQSASPPASAERTRPRQSAARAPQADEAQYRIGIEDILFVSVWRDPDLTREVPVRPDGKISLPLIQDMVAAGKTPAELGREIEERLKGYLSNPSVTVTVREINSLKVFVLGEVVKPGPLVVRNRVRLLQAIAMAGGVTPFGGRNGVLIYRNTPMGEKVLEVSYRDILRGSRPDHNVVLEFGDTVVVR